MAGSQRMTARRKQDIAQELSEDREQIALVTWCRYQPALKNKVIKINNEGIRKPWYVEKLKAMGMLRGTSDLFIARPTGGFHGLWIEIKRARHYTPSEMRSDTWLAQEAFLQEMRDAGYAGHFAYGCQHGIELIKSYLAMTLDEDRHKWEVPPCFRDAAVPDSKSQDVDQRTGTPAQNVAVPRTPCHQ